MPSKTSCLVVPLPEAAVLSDLYGVSYDLDTAAELCQRALTLARDEPDDYKLIEAVATAALVRYFRCLSTGARHGIIRADIEQLDAEGQSVHKYLKDVRDKFIAHSVSPFENCYVTASVTVKDGVCLPVRSLNQGHHRAILSKDTVRLLSELIRKVQAVNEAKIEVERSALLKLVQSLPLEVVHAWSLHAPKVLSQSDAGQTRPTRRRSGKPAKNGD